MIQGVNGEAKTESKATTKVETKAKVEVAVKFLEISISQNTLKPIFHTSVPSKPKDI